MRRGGQAERRVYRLPRQRPPSQKRLRLPVGRRIQAKSDCQGTEAPRSRHSAPPEAAETPGDGILPPEVPRKNQNPIKLFVVVSNAATGTYRRSQINLRARWLNSISRFLYIVEGL